MAIITLQDESEVRGLQQLIRERGGEDAFGHVQIVYVRLGAVYDVLAWDTTILGQIPTIAQIRAATARYTLPDDAPTIDLLARVKSLEDRLTRAGL